MKLFQTKIRFLGHDILMVLLNPLDDPLNL